MRRRLTRCGAEAAAASNRRSAQLQVSEGGSAVRGSPCFPGASGGPNGHLPNGAPRSTPPRIPTMCDGSAPGSGPPSSKAHRGPIPPAAWWCPSIGGLCRLTTEARTRPVASARGFPAACRARSSSMLAGAEEALYDTVLVCICQRFELYGTCIVASLSFMTCSTIFYDTLI
ncbi:hypothetical protein PVAP13_1KG177554 [Panicum virgatum]|uniref:Uncharacterized protein n=1 Tax=Panicum virgatum TaxID=38727 RepID=A0A8T0XHF0_PANVG|nr:hypothetical protein PVAP13_1KG177554 [Panicum virgatum]